MPNQNQLSDGLSNISDLWLRGSSTADILPAMWEACEEYKPAKFLGIALSLLEDEVNHKSV